MSGEKAAGPCGKFQANIFNKTKCQNCFKSQELHPLNELDMEQAKPIYAGWLCLAPEGTDFDNPVQRSRKWQRRFFILYEHGRLSYALDELPSTLPQGTLNLNLCTDITDAEPRTGQRNALCLVTLAQEIFIRGDNKEIINGWSEQLSIYLRTNKQNQKKKRKVDPVACQEPSPAKMAATDLSCPSTDGDSSESGRTAGPDVTPSWTIPDTHLPGPDWTPTGNTASHLGPVSGTALTSNSAVSSLDLAAAGNSESNNVHTSVNDQDQGQDRSRESSAERPSGVDVSRVGRTEARSSRAEKLQLTVPPPQRRAKSLDRRTSDATMTPDLLNFKKGWMVRLDENDQWKKYWFVLSTDSLRFYKDSAAEEASDLEGEIDLTTCFSVSEYEVHRNYGFQIHTQTGIFTLSAMTAGIRKNWIQALMKNVHPANAPDIASLPGHLKTPCRPPEVLPKPDVTQDSASSDGEPQPKPRSVAERRRDGRYRTFDWAEFRSHGGPASELQGALELGDLERRRRREERRRRYESMLGFSLGWEETGETTGDITDLRSHDLEQAIEGCWRLVEKAAIGPERTVPLCSEVRDAVEVEKMLQSSRRMVEDLKVQLAESERCRLILEAELKHQLQPPLCQAADVCPAASEKKPLRDRQEEEQLHQPEPPSAPLMSNIWLQDPQDLKKESQNDGHVPGRSVDPQLHPSSEANMNTFLILEENHIFPDQWTLQRLSQQVELLTSKNRALNQHNQEMLNQLTEADREIERLKVELSSRLMEPQQGKTHLDLEREMNKELLEAQTLIITLQDNLQKTEELLQLRNPTQSDGSELHQPQRLTKESQEETLEVGEENLSVSGEEKIQQVIKEMSRRLRALMKLLDVMAGVNLVTEATEEDTSPAVVSQLRWDERFWSLVLHKLKDAPSQLEEKEDIVLREMAEGLMLENQMLLVGMTGGLDLSAPEPETKLKPCEMEDLRSVTQMKMLLLNQLSSSISSTMLHNLQPAADRLHQLHLSERSSSVSFIRSAAAELESCCRLITLQSRHEQENMEMKARLLAVEHQLGGESYLQDPELQSTVGKSSGGALEGSDLNKVSELRGKVTELEDQLSALEDNMREQMRSVQQQHQEEVEKLKITCERGFTSMEECHLKVLEELQRLHQQEVERLLVERDRLLEEEIATTATAIEAIKNAHQAELQKEIQRGHPSEDTLLEGIHREELASYQRELDVLSEQFSLKCLENRHLVQALDAERKALCQCQQENQDLRTRNQELSAHLAAEITRLCSLAKRDSLPLGPRMDTYEMEITLRVKESEVQCLKQEITSLKDELQSALKDKRNAARKLKDMFAELNSVRAEAERDTDELKEKLRLTRLAVEETSAC